MKVTVLITEANQAVHIDSRPSHWLEFGGANLGTDDADREGHKDCGHQSCSDPCPQSSGGYK